jgi:hypothetical protein
VATLQVQLRPGSLVRASVREHSGVVDLKVSTNDSRVAQELPGEIARLRNSLDTSGLKLESVALKYQDHHTEGRHSEDPESNGGKRDQTPDNRQIFIFQESDQ